MDRQDAMRSGFTSPPDGGEAKWGTPLNLGMYLK